MSRIGLKPIEIPDKVKVTVGGQHIRVEGPKGSLELNVPYPIKVRQEEGVLKLDRPNDARQNRALHGLSRALLHNMVLGVSRGFVRELQINGVGYRAEARGSQLTLDLGYSHQIKYELPKGISATVERNTLIRLEGADKQLLGETAAKIRAFRPPEPYKGKGVKYVEEQIRRKVGKKNV